MTNNDSSSRKKMVKALVSSLTKTNNIDSTTLNRMNAVLDSTVLQLEKTVDMINNPTEQLKLKNNILQENSLPGIAKVACQGVPGAYSHIATKSWFENPDIAFYSYFEDVTQAVNQREVDFGILPVENSSAGTVEEVIELVCEYNCYINSMSQIKVEHCLAAAPGTELKNIKKVYSHPQALKQSADFLKNNNFEKSPTSNTAVAAQKIAEQKNPEYACLCSPLSAQIYGLEILKKGVQDQKENYTRFICISKDAIILPQADTVSIALSFPNQPGALSTLLTMFSAFHLDLSKIQSMPIGGADFNVRFHLDFIGNISDLHVENLLGQMYSIYDDFQFLGNYKKI